MISDCLWNKTFNLYCNAYIDKRLDLYNDHKLTLRENISYLFKPFSTFVSSSFFSTMIFGLSSTLHSSYEITFTWFCPSESINGAEELSLEISSTPFVFSESIKCWKLIWISCHCFNELVLMISWYEWIPLIVCSWLSWDNSSLWMGSSGFSVIISSLQHWCGDGLSTWRFFWNFLS